MRRYILPLALVVVTAPASLAAQTASDLLTRGIAAYRSLNYDNAVALLRSGLAVRGTQQLGDSARIEAWSYLAAAELFRGQVDSAALAFARALRVEPRFRPDQLVFPPNVTDFFETVRGRTAYVRVVAPADTTIRAGDESYVVRLYGSAPHAVLVEIGPPDGEGVRRTIYEGRLEDSLDVSWDGLDSSRRPIEDSDLVLLVTSMGPDTRRTVRLPLLVSATRPDTLDLPPPLAPTSLLPEREYNRQRLGTLVAGIMTGIAAAALPSLVASDGEASRARYVVGGIIGITGVLGFASQSEYRVIPENVAANAARREAWRRQFESARDENDRRRRDVRLRITTRPQTLEPEER